MAQDTHATQIGGLIGWHSTEVDILALCLCPDAQAPIMSQRTPPQCSQPVTSTIVM